MARVNISIRQLSMKLDITERSLRNKLNGVTEFTLTESMVIKAIINETNGTDITLLDKMIIMKSEQRGLSRT